MKNLAILANAITVANGRYRHACRELVIATPDEKYGKGRYPIEEIKRIKTQALDEVVALERKAGNLVRRAADIEEFERRTGLEFDAQGPALAICAECEKTFQYLNDHDCRRTTIVPRYRFLK